MVRRTRWRKARSPTTSGAADSAGKTDWRPLAGRTVTIWLDNDEAGHRYAEAVVDALRAQGCAVRVIDVAALNMEPKVDAVDWLAANPDAKAADVLVLPCTEAPLRDVSDARKPRACGPSCRHSMAETETHSSHTASVAFDPDTLLPEALRGWIMDEADRMPGPLDFIAVGALVALGAIIGARCAIKPKVTRFVADRAESVGRHRGLCLRRRSPPPSARR